MSEWFQCWHQAATITYLSELEKQTALDRGQGQTDCITVLTYDFDIKCPLSSGHDPRSARIIKVKGWLV